MENTFKRFLSLVLAFTMVLSYVPVNAFADETTPASCESHDYSFVQVTNPTCTDGGYTTYTCSVCSDSYTADETEALGHSYASVVTDPTCGAAGYTTYTCSICGDSYTGDAVEATGHNFVDGFCTACGVADPDAQENTEAPAEETTEAAACSHAYTSVVTAPTCTEAGYTTYTCSLCSESYTADEVGATGHSFVDGKCACGEVEETEPEVDEQVVAVQAMIDALPDVVYKSQLDEYQAKVNEITAIMNTMTKEQTDQLTGLEKLYPTEIIDDTSVIYDNKIETVADLQEFAVLVNSGTSFAGEIVTLANDLDLDYTAVIIGTATNPFKGTFDGQNHIISNLTIYENGYDSDYFKDSDSYVGLFGYVVDATIKDVTVDNPFIVGEAYVGGIVGCAYTGTVENCHVTGKIDIEGFYMVGGITGHGYAKIKNCSVIGEEGWDYNYVGATYKEADLEGDNVGGIVGHHAEGSELSGCTVKNVTVEGTRKVGGIVGTAFQNNDIADCTVENVTVGTNADVEYASSKANSMGIGGIVGLTSGDYTGGTIKNCSVKEVTFTNENDVTVSAGAITGGHRGGGQVPVTPEGTTIENIVVEEISGANNAFCVPAAPLPDYVVLPTGVTVDSFGENTVTDGTNYYATLQAAVEAVSRQAGAVLYCKPGADVGSLQHAPVTATLTVYGNGASVTGGSERDFDIGNTDPSGGKDITADMTLTVKYLNGCGAWGAKDTDHTVNLVFENCENMGKVFITGTTGTLNITMTDCSFEGVLPEAVYSNANGKIELTNVDFSNLNKAVNLNHKAAGTQEVVLTDCTFSNCGNDVSADQIPVRVLSSVEGGNSTLTVSNCTFTGTPTGGADILLDYAVGETIANISGTAANVTVEKENNVGTNTAIAAEESKEFTNVASPVVKIGEKGYKSLQAAIDAVQNGDTIVLNADITEELVTIEKASGVAFTIDGAKHKFTGELEIGIGESLTIRDVNFVASEEISPEYFIDSMDRNSNCVLTVQNCTFTDTDYSTTAIGTHQPTQVVIDGCTTAGVASLLQNQGGYNITVKNTTVEGKRGISLGAVVGATVENVTINAADDKYGIRLNGENNNNTITIKDCTITAFIPVVVRKAQVENYNVVFDGTNTMTATNTDGLWCAIGTSEYEANGTMPTAPTGKVQVALNDTGLNKSGMYGHYVAPPAGSGTEADPLRITSLEDLTWFRDDVNSGNNYSGKFIQLTDSIDLNNEEWTPIGTETAPFKGTFDGGEKTISNLKITHPGNNTVVNQVGLFGKTYGATIRNLTVHNASVTGSGSVAAVVGNFFTGTMTNVHLTGNIKIAAYQYVGGLIGWGYATVENCSVTGDGVTTSFIKKVDKSEIHGSGTNGYVGGVCGWIGEGNSKITGCSVKNVTITTNDDTVGGICGIFHYGNTFTDCSLDTVTITAPDNDGYNGIIAGHVLTAQGSKNTYKVTVNNVTATAAGEALPALGNGSENIADTSTGNVLSGTVVNKNDVVATVGDTSYTTLQDAINAGGEVKLLADIALTEGVTVPADKTVTLDLNGKTITGTPTADAKSYAVIENKGTLTITGEGKVKCDNNLTAALVGAVNTIANSGTLVIDGADIVNESATVKQQIGYAIDTYKGTVTIKNGAVKASGSNYYDGIRLCAMNETDDNTVIVAGGEVSSIWMQNTSDGSADHNTKNVKGNVTITGGTVNALYLEPSSNFTASITGGYVGSISEHDTNDTETRVPTGFITGGFFADNKVQPYLASGYELYYDTAAGKLGVKAGVVATVDGDEYATLEAAVEAAYATGAPVYLKRNVVLSETLNITGEVTLNLKGFTISGTDNNTSGNFYLINNTGKLTIKDSTGGGKITLTAKNDRQWSASSVVVANNPGGELTVESGTIEHTGGTSMAYGIDNLTNGDTTSAVVTINGGTIKSTYSAVRQFLNGNGANNTLTINGGTLEAGKRAVYFQAPSKTKPSTGTLTIGENAVINSTVYLGVTEGSTEWPVKVSISAAALKNGAKVEAANVPNGYGLVEKNGVHTVMSGVAKIEDEYFDTIDAALAAAKSGDTITLMKDAQITQTYDVEDMTLTIEGTGTLDVNDKLFVRGESTLNISCGLKNQVILRNDAILKDSTINGNVFLFGKVTFRGSNTVSLVEDFGTHRGYGQEADQEWIVEAGSSLTMTKGSRYGLGYGDKVTIYGSLVDAMSARESLTDADRSAYLNGGISMMDAWDVDNYLTVEDAYVEIGKNNSFGTKADYGNKGNFYVTFDNSVLDSSRVTVVSGGGEAFFTFNKSDAKVGVWHFNQATSTASFTDSYMLVTGTGNDYNNANAGEMTLTNSKIEFQTGAFTNNGTIEMDINSSITAPNLAGNGKIVIDATGFNGTEVELISGISNDITIEVINNVDATYKIEDGKLIITTAPVAEVDGVSYTTLEAALKAVKANDTVTILRDITINEYWDARYTGAKFTVPVTIDGNGKTIEFTNTVYDGGNYFAAFRFEAAATVKNLTIDMSEAISGFQGRFRAISAKADLIVDNCTFIGNGSTNNTRAIIFGEGAGDNIGNVTASVTNSTFINWKRGLTDNENAQNAKSVTVTGNTFTDAGVNISAAETVVFTDNKVNSAEVVITSYNDIIENIEVTGNTMGEGATGKVSNTADYTGIQSEFTIGAAVNVISGGVTKYFNTLEAAVTAAQNGDEVKINKAGTYKVPSGKNITVTGTVAGVVFDNIGTHGMGGASVTFNNVTFNYAENSSYMGLQHSGNLVYNNCIFNGQVFLYGESETFNNCTFNNTGDNYNVWTYSAKKVAFNECTFNCAGKSVLVYAEGGDHVTEVSVTKSNFNATASAEGKAAIEMDSSLTAGIKLTVTDSTANGFGSGNVSGSSLWNNKKGSNTDANNDITVVVNGETVLKPVTFVAKIGNIGYADLHEAMVATKAGETLVLVADVDLTGTEWEPVAFKGTFDGQNHTISNLTINKPGVSNTGFIQSLNGTFKNVTFTNPTVTGGECTGVVAGRAGGSSALAENITVNGTIKVETTHSGYARAGVIVGGWAYGNYENITVDGGDKAVSYIKHTGGGDGRYVAGIVGHADDVQSYVNCTVKNITISGGWLCGGIAGPGPSKATASGCSVDNINMNADYSGGMFGWYTGSGTIENGSVKNVTFTDGSTNNGAIGGYGVNDAAKVTNVTIENVTNNGKPLLEHVAEVNGIYYTSLQDAVNAGGKVKILRNITLTEGVVVEAGKTVTLDLNGKTVSMEHSTKVTANHTMISNSGNLTIQDTAGNGKLSYKYVGEDIGTTKSTNTVTSNPGSVLTVKSGTIENQTYESSVIAYAIDGLTNGNAGDVTVNIEGGTITSKRQAVRIFANSTTNTGSLNISDGDITGRVIVQNANTNANKAALNITGGTFNVNEYKNEVLSVGGSNSATISIVAAVSGGTFKGAITETNVKGFITGGSFVDTTAADYGLLAEGCELKYDAATKMYGVIAEPVASVAGVNYNTLQEAIDAAAANETVYVLKDIALKNTVTIPADKTITLNLKGNSITGTPTAAAAYEVIKNEGNLTVTGNGKILCDHQLSGSTAYAVNTITNRGTLVIDGAVIENKSTAPSQIGYAIDTSKVTVTIKSGEVKASGSNYYDGIRLCAMNETDDNTVIVEGGEVSSIWMQNTSDGSADHNTKNVKGNVTITGGTVNALYLEPSSNFTASITGGYVGSISEHDTNDTETRVPTGFITGGTFGADVTEYCADGYKAVKNDDNTYGVVAKAASGKVSYRAYINDSNTREAIQIDMENVYAKESFVVELYDAADNKLTTTTLKAGGVEAANYTANVVLWGNPSGSWDTEVHAVLTEANVPATIKLYADGILVDTYENALGAGTNVDETAKYLALDILKPDVAKIGDKSYKSLAAAFEAAVDGDTISLIDDIELSETIKNTKTITLDLGGKTISGKDNNTSGNFYLIDNSGELTVTGNGTVTLEAADNREWNSSSVVIANNPGGKLDVENGTIEHLGGTDMAYAIDNLTNGKGTYAETVINGGTVKSTYRAVRQYLNGIEAQNILTVNGGTIEGANKSIFFHDPSAKANTGTLTVSGSAALKGDVYLFVTDGSTEWPVAISIASAALKDGSEVLSANVPERYTVKQNTAGNWTVEEVDAAVKNTKKDAIYATITEAIAAASSGDELVLLKNHREEEVILRKRVKLDLAGYDLTTDAFVGMTGTQVLNTKTTGILRVPQDAISLDRANTYVPFWNENDGYYLLEWGYSYGGKYVDAGYEYYFLPKPRNDGTVNNAVVKLLQNGAAGNDITIEAELSWDTENGRMTQSLVYKESQIQNVYTSNANLDKNGLMFLLNVAGYDNFTNVNLTSVTVSNLGPRDACKTTIIK